MWWLTSVFAGVVILVYSLLYLPSFQTFAAQRVASFLNYKYGLQISIGKVKIEFVKTVSLEDVFVKDLQGDTLLFAGVIDLNIEGYNLERSQFYLQHLGIENMRFRMHTRANDSLSNLEHVINLLLPDDTVTTENSQPTTIKTKTISIKNLHFSLKYANDSTRDSGIDYEDMDITKLHASLEDVLIIDDSISANITKLAFNEKSGFKLNKLAANVSVSSTQAVFENLNILTKKSKLFGYYKMEYKHWSDYLDYIPRVKMTINLTKSVAHTDDVAFFAPALAKWHQRIDIAGKAKGTVDNLNGKGLDVAFLNSTAFKGNVSISGLPDFSSSFISIDAKIVKTTVDDAQRFCDFAVDTGIVIPKELKELGYVAFTGSFTGFPNHFTSYGFFTSKAGVLKTDISLEEKDKTYYYKGRLATEALNLKYLTANSDFGNLNSLVTVEGHGFSLKNIDAVIKGDFYSFNYNGYDYHNIYLNGGFEKAKFVGELTSNDPYANFEFDGELDFNQTRPLLNFDADLHTINLSRLNFMADSLDSELSGQIRLRAQGLKVSDIVGNAVVNNLFFCQSGREYHISTAELIARNKPRELQLYSPIADVQIKGNFIPEELPQSFLSVVADAIPALALSTKKKQIKQEFSFSATIKDATILKEFVPDSINISAGTAIAGYYDNTVNTFEVLVQSPSGNYSNYHWNNANIFAKKANDILNADVQVASFLIGDSLYFNNLDVLAKVVDNNLQFSVGWQNNADNLGKFEGVGQILGPNKFQIDLLPGFITVHGQQWNSINPTAVFYDSSRFSIKNFLLKYDEHELYADGKISAFNGDRLNIEVRKFNLRTIGFFVPIGTNLSGEINGTGFISNPYDKLSFQADLKLSNFQMSNQYLGELSFNALWNKSDSAVTISSVLDKNGSQSLTLKGFYRPTESENPLAVDVTLKDFNLATLNALNLGFITDFGGAVSGNMDISGTFETPQLKGVLNLQDAQMRVDYLNTTYKLNDKVLVNPQWIGFNRIKVTDQEGNRATATGTAFHKNFKNWNYDFAVQMVNFLAINTNSTQNELFYGTAYGTGDVNISGYRDNLEIEVKAKTARGTKMSIPLGGAEEVYAQEFVRFINTGQLDAEESDINLTGIKLNLDIEATEDAEVKLIFDEKIGDVITGTGFGRLSMEVSPSGDFKMYGRYQISRGNYLFTLKNVINKNFTISKGGTITWFGDPYEAYVDLDAEYHLRTSLSNIMLTNDERYKRRELVKCIMHMSGKLLEPNIRFDIAVPNADDFVKGQLAAVKNDENELNKQFLSLLVTQSFSQLQNGVKDAETAGGPSTVGSNSMELLAGQLNNWLSGVSKDFSVGVNLRSGDDRNTGEYKLSVGKPLFNNRVNVYSNVGLASRSNTQQNANSFVGDVAVEYSLTPDGRFKIKAFRESSDNVYSGSGLSPYTQGSSIFYQEQFDTFKELRRNMATLFERKKKKKATQNNTDLPQ